MPRPRESYKIKEFALMRKALDAYYASLNKLAQDIECKRETSKTIEELKKTRETFRKAVESFGFVCQEEES